MAILTRLRRWGNSMGIVVPREALINQNLKEGEEVMVEIEKRTDISDVFGSLKDCKINAQKFKDETRKQEAKK